MIAVFVIFFVIAESAKLLPTILTLL